MQYRGVNNTVGNNIAVWQHSNSRVLVWQAGMEWSITDGHSVSQVKVKHSLKSNEYGFFFIAHKWEV